MRINGVGSWWLALGGLLLVGQTASAQPFSVLHPFAVGTDGGFPRGVIQATDGNFYGTTQNGGAHGQGTVFKMTPSGDVTVLYNFTGGTVDGSAPTAGLVQGTDGNFYGTTSSGGSTSDYGTVFMMTPAGSVTTLHVFAGSDGDQPEAALIQAADGAFYGTTFYGGAHGPGTGGTVFKITSAGAFTLLYSFANDADGAGPHGALVQAPNGNFYGTTFGGGPDNAGTVFMMTPAGVHTVLHGFVMGTDGVNPAGLIQAIDGNFYGTAFSGGMFGLGTAYKVTPAGVLSVLHAFAGTSDGAYPQGVLLQGSDLNFYGTTAYTTAGFGGYGTLFTMTFGGAVSSLHVFGATDGKSPRDLIHANDGNFYGTTDMGGSLSAGVAYRLLNPASCDDTLTLSYVAGTLNLGFTVMSATPATWSAWLVVTSGSAKLWSIAIPIVSPAVSFTLPLSGFPHVGEVLVVTTLSPTTGPICADLKAVNTGP
jgi:uncharacterized repeat protein (TIGR03803 family)